jgi:hypothetical protein
MSNICEFLNAASSTLRSFCTAFVLRWKSVNDRPRASGSAASLDGRTSGKLKENDEWTNSGYSDDSA